MLQLMETRRIGLVPLLALLCGILLCSLIQVGSLKKLQHGAGQGGPHQPVAVAASCCNRLHKSVDSWGRIVLRCFSAASNRGRLLLPGGRSGLAHQPIAKGGRLNDTGTIRTQKNRRFVGGGFLQLALKRSSQFQL